MNDYGEHIEFEISLSESEHIEEKELETTGQVVFHYLK